MGSIAQPRYLFWREFSLIGWFVKDDPVASGPADFQEIYVGESLADFVLMELGCRLHSIHIVSLAGFYDPEDLIDSILRLWVNPVDSWISSKPGFLTPSKLARCDNCRLDSFFQADGVRKVR